MIKTTGFSFSLTAVTVIADVLTGKTVKSGNIKTLVLSAMRIEHPSITGRVIS